LAVVSLSIASMIRPSIVGTTNALVTFSCSTNLSHASGEKLGSITILRPA
jgi:hypothetical protein